MADTRLLSDLDVDSLEHVGVKGMKWGVRKKRDSGGDASGSAKKAEKIDHPKSAEHLKSRELRKRKVETLSNIEIQTLNKRIELERKYKQLNPSKFAAGMAKVKVITENVNTVVSAVNTINKFSNMVPNKKKDQEKEKEKEKESILKKSGGGSQGTSQQSNAKRFAEAKAAAREQASKSKAKPTGETTMVDLKKWEEATFTQKPKPGTDIVELYNIRVKK